MTVQSWRLHIDDWHPAALNEYIYNRWKAHKLKKRDRTIVGIYANISKIPKATKKRQVILTLFLEKGCRGADPDAYNKSLNDALVHAGLLKNDSKEWVENMPTRYDRHADRHKQSVIELIEV